MYYDIWGDTPHADPDVCASTRYATGMMALTCFCVTFLCVGMGFGGYIDDKATFILYWFLHLVGGSMYTASTVIVPIAHWSNDGEDCSDLNPVNGERLSSVYYLHASLYLVYVGGMLSITYFSFLKNVLPELPPAGLIVAAAVVFIIPQAIVYGTF